MLIVCFVQKLDGKCICICILQAGAALGPDGIPPEINNNNNNNSAFQALWADSNRVATLRGQLPEGFMMIIIIIR